MNVSLKLNALVTSLRFGCTTKDLSRISISIEYTQFCTFYLAKVGTFHMNGAATKQGILKSILILISNLSSTHQLYVNVSYVKRR